MRGRRRGALLILDNLVPDTLMTQDWEDGALQAGTPPGLPVTLGTDFDGMGVPRLALEALGVPFVHRFGSECAKAARAFALANGTPDVQYRDAAARDGRLAPDVQLYVAGFPCQAYSAAGAQAGPSDPRGRLFEVCRDYIRARRPLCFVLENVPNFAKACGGALFEALLTDLRDNGTYAVSWQVVDAKFSGVPQRRPRLLHNRNYRCSAEASLPVPTCPLSHRR